jgi:CDP-diacylglycerol---glycerol-3-phosphate 3-phosphatidyltransferase
MITRYVSKERARALLLPITRWLAASGISPNALTATGFCLVLGSAAVVLAGYRQLGGVLFLLTTAFDMFDGAVAQLTNRKTTFGAFLDSNLDRYAEIAIFAALLIPSAMTGSVLDTVLCYAAVTGSLMVSYARARAEGLGLTAEVGWFQRPERTVLLALGLILNLVTPVLVILAVLSYATAIQRMIHVWRVTRGS